MAALSSDMASKVDALDKGSVAKFQTRADAVFRNLGPEDVQVRPEASSSWQLKKEQVFRSGKEAEDASSEEEAEDPAQQLITGDMLGMRGDEEEKVMATASRAFCRALDQEDEYDATDALASQSLRAHPAPDRPPLETEVLADNIYERRVSHAGAGPSTPSMSASMMDIDMHMLGGAAAPSHAHSNGPGLADIPAASAGMGRGMGRLHRVPSGTG
ncbi:hypothetical protein WJX84_006916 [Apatococcus fuscideae]|uniref:Uncharacterized protein n=1 Tax=Apatococcus fuscideae TaxID=2026836 RepID=A0AAW1SZ85_9CHLO